MSSGAVVGVSLAMECWMWKLKARSKSDSYGGLGAYVLHYRNHFYYVTNYIVLKE